MSVPPRQIAVKIVSNALDKQGADPSSKRNIIDIMENDPKFQAAFGLEIHLKELESVLQKVNAEAVSKAIGEDKLHHKDGPSVTVNWGFLNNLTNTIRGERKLTQFLGVGLRGVLPYAEREVEYLYDVAKRDDDDVVRQEADIASRDVTRAQAALNRLEVTELKIKDIAQNAFDDDFQVIFDDEVDET